MGDLQTAEYQAFRKERKAFWKAQNAACGICGQQTIDYDAPKNTPDALELDHKISRKRARAMGRLDLVLDPNNAQPTHHRCNRGKSSGDQRPGIGVTSEAW